MRDHEGRDLINDLGDAYVSLHDRCQRALNLTAEPDIESHRDEAEAGNKSRHEDGPQALKRTFEDGLIQSFSAFAALADEA